MKLAIKKFNFSALLTYKMLILKKILQDKRAFFLFFERVLDVLEEKKKATSFRPLKEERPMAK
jgi:hypothetical protein